MASASASPSAAPSSRRTAGAFGSHRIRIVASRSASPSLLKRKPMNDEPTVFVVDDDAAVRASLSWMIESAGLPVEADASAEDFLASYDITRAGCLVLDMRMPGMSGIALQKQLAATKSDLAIIFRSEE